MSNICKFINSFKNVNQTVKKILLPKNDLLLLSSYRCSSYVANFYTKDKDPAPLFFNLEIQSLLKRLTRVDLNKVYRKKKRGEKWLDTPEYRFMTDKQLQDAMEEIKQKADKVLQMPPAIVVRDSMNQILSKDPALQGYDSSKFVFVDISHDCKDSERTILIREPNGDLIKADWDVRHRMNQIFAPRTGRRITMPRMFEKEYFENLLERHEYIFILDRACVQFEPDDPKYQEITSLTYEHVNDNNQFDVLRSTRHFGSFAFYLIWFKNIDNLLLDIITSKNIFEGAILVQLYNKLHKNEKVAELSEDEDVCVKIVEEYVENATMKKSHLELALQTYKQTRIAEKELESGIKRAHGIT